MTLRKLIKHIKIAFAIGGTFSKGWMITMPIFAFYIIYNTYDDPENGWIFFLFTISYVIGYVIGTYCKILAVINGKPISDWELAKKIAVEEYIEKNGY